MNGFRAWMYEKTGNKGLSNEFVAGVASFCDWAFTTNNKNVVLCPCSVCKCREPKLGRNAIELHLYQNGFRPSYYIWTRHDEKYGQQGVDFDMGGAGPSSAPMEEEEEFFESDRDFVDNWFPGGAEEPNDDAKEFYDLLNAADQPIYPGHNLSLLHWITQIFKFKQGATQAQVEEYIRGCRSMALPEHQDKIPGNYYQFKKMMLKLGLGVIKYDVCKYYCCIYYKECSDLTCCPTCNEPRYIPRTNARAKLVPQKKLWYFPITKRLQRLYMSKATAESMTWHTRCRGKSDKMVHPAQSESWQTFDQIYPNFAAEDRNVRVGLCTDGFCPTEQYGNNYSCWPVFITPYNLEPELCMRQEFIFMSLMISGPKEPGRKIDVMLRPLIDELNELWEVGANTWDCVRQENFRMRVAVMWTISDFPAYGMLSGWSTHSRLSCPYCQEDTDAFRLVNGHKPCWFDCHRAFLPPDHPMRYNAQDFKLGNTVDKVMSERKTPMQNKRKLDELPEIDFRDSKAKFPRYGKDHNWTKKSIFWELSYWGDLLVPNVLDVMHCEKNFFDNIFHTVMDESNASKDNKQAREDLELHTGRESLFITDEARRKKPKAAYTLTLQQRKAVCDWLKELRFPDGHVSNLATHVKEQGNKITGFKTHDCHVFMQRLLPIAFKGFLPIPVWEALTEVSNAFRAICGSEISAQQMILLSRTVVVTLCKLEMIFPPAFFDCMEHLLIHLPYEAQVCGPVFYRWMYPFERYRANLLDLYIFHYDVPILLNWRCDIRKLGILKGMARQKNRLEGSMCEAYLLSEITNFCDFYFGHGPDTAMTRLSRNQIAWLPQFEGQFSIFYPKGRAMKTYKREKDLSAKEYNQVLQCILMNCEEAQKYLRYFEQNVNRHHSVEDREHFRINELVPWFKQLSRAREIPQLDFIVNGGSVTVTELQGYFVNGFKFHTETYGSTKSTMNSGVLLRSEDEDKVVTEYYGIIQDIIEMKFHCSGRPEQKIHLFKCDWFDNRFVSVDQYGLIDLLPDSRLVTDEPYILANMAGQVYYSPYPFHRVGRHRRKVLAVCPIRARHVIDISSTVGHGAHPDNEQDYYQDEAPPTDHELFVDFTSFNLQMDLADTLVGEVVMPSDGGC